MGELLAVLLVAVAGPLNVRRREHHDRVRADDHVDQTLTTDSQVIAVRKLARVQTMLSRVLGDIILPQDR